MDKVVEEGGVQRRFSATPIVPTLSVPIIAPTLSAHPPAVKGGLLLCIELPSQTIFFSAQGKFPSAQKKVKKTAQRKFSTNFLLGWIILWINLLEWMILLGWIIILVWKILPGWNRLLSCQTFAPSMYVYRYLCIQPQPMISI